MHAFRGKEFIEYDNPYDVGMTGLVGFASGYAAMKNCDALLRIPMTGQIASLNVSVATGIVLFAWRSRRDRKP